VLILNISPRSLAPFSGSGLLCHFIFFSAEYAQIFSVERGRGVLFFGGGLRAKGGLSKKTKWRQADKSNNKGGWVF